MRRGEPGVETRVVSPVCAGVSRACELGAAPTRQMRLRAVTRPNLPAPAARVVSGQGRSLTVLPGFRPPRLDTILPA